MNNKWLWLIASWITLATLVGCSQGITIDLSEATTQPPTSVQIGKTERPPTSTTSLPATQTAQEAPVNDYTPPISYDPALEPLVEQARQDLAERLNIAEGTIVLIEAKDVVWPDASLGCPHPDMLYKQVPEDGALIILKVAEREYEYHSGGGRGLFLCENLLKTKKITPNINIVIPPPARSIDE